MKIGKAAKLLRAGKWVARDSWKPTKRALFYNPNDVDGASCGIRTADGALGSHRGSYSRGTWELTFDDLRANDWAEVEPSPGYLSSPLLKETS